MDKGWGLTLESDPIGLLVNKSPATPRLNHSRGTMFSGIKFPVSLNCIEDQSAPITSGESRPVVDEVDFFSEKHKANCDHLDSNSSATISVKKENSNGKSTPLADLDVNTGLQLLTANTASDQSMVDDGISSDAEDKKAKNELAVLQAELERMNAENQSLRGMLTHVSDNYSALQMHMVALMQQHQTLRTHTISGHDQMVEGKSEDRKHGPTLPRQFLGLAPSATNESDEPSNSSSEERTQDRSSSPQNTMEVASKEFVLSNKNSGRREMESGGREESPESEGWTANKVPKLPTSKPIDQATEATMRKARVSVRARSEAPMITDGCQWRKYGQKMAKGNPCPRAYYRCTMAVGCPVRKQVQRCAEDRSILITTYEGTHNHPLPPAAVAMASTTSAAANMLLSGSMSSADSLMNPNFLARAILPCSSSMATISASAPFPTVTLDLTHSPNPLQFQRPPAQLHVPFPAHQQHQPQPFSGTSPPLPQVFGQPLYNQSKFSGLQVSQAAAESAQLPHLPPPQPQPASLSDTVNAATAAITADPHFTAALVAAITSIMGGGGHPNNNNNNTSTSTAPSNNNTGITASNSNKTSSFTGN